MRKLLTYFLVGILAFLSVVFIKTPVIATQATVDPKIPTAIAKCLLVPDRYETIGIASDSGTGKSFYLVESRSNKPGEYQMFIIESSSQSCKNLWPKDGNEFKSWMTFLPKEVARQLSLGHYQAQIKKGGGLENFKRAFLSPESDGYHSPNHPVEVTLQPEAAWALRQLGIEIPANFKVLPEPSDKR